MSFNRDSRDVRNGTRHASDHRKKYKAGHNNSSCSACGDLRVVKDPSRKDRVKDCLTLWSPIQWKAVFSQAG
jgi:hypothetical protein